ncbi:MAG: sigma-70 family RNA polymerase sigma factor [Novosphingobium sp.]|nr:sigma-70 family RNA polymerase sigma factor [Novosphingobium sp.]MCP5401954.1 sigma-70 family RNA polymerase sigma factor [Novosphingobium sp.]
MSDTDESREPLPLDRYSRTDETVADIQALAALDNDGLIAAFGEAGETAPNYRSTEALVFFILRALDRQDDRATNALFKVLRARCWPYLNKWVRGVSNVEDRMDIQGRVIEQMTIRLLKGGPECDFLQARFWRYLKLRTLSAIGEFKKLRSREGLIDDLDPGDESLPLIDQIQDTQLSPEARLLIRDALDTLPPELRETYLLRHFQGWRVGDERNDETDPNDPTLMEYFGIGRRAIHKRLTKAEALLERYRKDNE